MTAQDGSKRERLCYMLS